MILELDTSFNCLSFTCIYSWRNKVTQKFMSVILGHCFVNCINILVGSNAKLILCSNSK